jgi:hypothetical protein
MHNYLLLARGRDLASARVLAVSADESVVSHFLAVLADEDDQEQDADEQARRLVPVGDGD